MTTPETRVAHAIGGSASGGVAAAVAGVAAALDSALAAAGVVFPPAIAANALLKAITLCARVKAAYDKHRAVMDETVPNLQERVAVLEVRYTCAKYAGC